MLISDFTMTKFRPCIDLHNGQVKQIVGGSLTDDGESLRENFVADRSAGEFSCMYRDRQLTGGHVIMLGPGNKDAALEALAEWPQGMQVGGGINIGNAREWITAGASHVIITSWLFSSDGEFQMDRLKQLAEEIGKEKVVVDLSCRKTHTGWTVAMNRWQTLTNMDVTHENLDLLAQYCDEYLVHAADVEGLCQGVDETLCKYMGDWGKIPMTYAGGVASMDDLEVVSQASQGKIDITVGSALDIFGGSGVSLEQLVAWNNA